MAERAILRICGFLPKIPTTVLRKMLTPCHPEAVRMVMVSGDDLEWARVGKGEAAGTEDEAGK